VAARSERVQSQFESERRHKSVTLSFVIPASAGSKRCSSCGKDQPLGLFRNRGGKKRHLLDSWCKPCVLLRNRSRYKQINENRRRSRSSGTNTARWILKDAKSSDKKRGFVCDLTKADIETIISCPCSYCGETSLRMTLDRIDNARGHTLGNVVPACIRCNYVRRDMPYAAWLIVAEGVRKAAAQNLFGAWIGSTHKRSKHQILPS
jgi:hypothetical protein